MPHVPPLVSTIAIGLVLAFAFGVRRSASGCRRWSAICWRASPSGRLPRDSVADQNIANQLAEVGVILLMFGVGLHFSLKDLLSVRAIAVPGALAQGLVATPLGMGARLAARLAARRRHHLRHRAVGGEHRGAAARVAGAPAARDRARADHRRLADRAGHRHGAGAGAAAGAGRAVSRRGDGAGDGRGGALGRHGRSASSPCSSP